MPRRRGSTAPLCLLLMLLASPWKQRAGPQLADGQGLDVPTELLGAGETATLSQFQVLQDVLAALNDNDGGRSGKGGTGDKGSSSGKTGAALATDAKGFSNLLQSLYSVAGAPAVYNSFNTSQTRGGHNYQPTVRDQGVCDSCVAQAIAAAMEASVASTLQQDTSAALNVSAQTLYYCSQGWRSCKTGWDLRQALAQVVDETPWLVRPGSCASARELTTPALEPEISSWASICAASLAQPCAAEGATPAQQQWLKCSFRALSTFAEIQAAIRTHGSVVTRMTVYNDFAPFFSASNNSAGFASQPYKVTKGARPVFGHAVIITGYDNIGFTWTVQNSWGCSGANCSSAAAGARRPGVTQDGRFRIRMGDAGVGAPGQTFAVACEPAPGSPDDLHSARPWRVRRDMPLQLLRQEDVNDLSRDACFSYQPKPGDTPAAVAAAFQLDIRQLARDNPGVFPLINGSLLIRSAMDARQMADIIHEVNAAAPVKSSGAIAPFFRCRTYNGPVIGRPRECRGVDFAPCAGLSPCWIYFPQQDLDASIQGKAVKVCNISSTVPADRPEDRAVPYFADEAARQGRALKALLQVIGIKRGNGARLLKNVTVPASLKEQCDTTRWLPALALQLPGSVGFQGRLVLRCNKRHQITSVEVGVVSFPTSTSSPQARREADDLVNALQSFAGLTSIWLSVDEGELPPQLGTLGSLEYLGVVYDCMTGHLPPHLVEGLPKLQGLDIAVGYFSESQKDTSCGITGPVPGTWSDVNSSITRITLADNRLSGALPSFEDWQSLEWIDLRNNGFTGPLPTSWARLPGMWFIDVSSNKLQGMFPYEWQSLSGRLNYLYVHDNPDLQGCIPLIAYHLTITHTNTNITGKCTVAGARQEADEMAALQQLLPKVFNPAAAPDARAWNATIRALLADLNLGLRAIISPGADYGQRVVPVTGGVMVMYVKVIHGVAHVKSLWAQGAAGIDLSYLPRLVSRLPKLHTFECSDCYCKASLSKGACVLPSNLASKAPASLTTLSLRDIKGMAGSLPPSWGNWSTLQRLDLRSNDGLSGTLPATWANMASLRSLYLGRCAVRGMLPPSWGEGPMAKSMKELFLQDNKLQGTIPWSWGGLQQAVVWLGDNVMDWNNSCIPDGVYIIADEYVPPPCSSLNTSQAGMLEAIKGELQAGSSKAGKVLPSWVNPGAAGVGVPPNYCTKWQGVTCDSANNVVGLQLSDLAVSVDLDSLANLTLKLPKLSTLDLSRMNVSGDLSSPSVAQLVMQRQLQHLNLSGNPDIVGQLPELWAGSRLQTVDLSGCGISGPLPPTWAALQQLRVLRLSAAGGQGGQLQSTLPSEWGLLVRLTELDISGHAGITGSLPAAWPDAAAMQAVAAAAAAAAAERAAQAEAALDAATGQGITTGDEVAAASAGSGSWSAAQQYKQVSAAAREAAAAKRVLAALQAAADSSSDGVSAAAAGSGGLGMRQLQVLRLAGCGLSGGIPASLADLQQLRELDLSHNTGLGGQLPLQWGALSQLQSLHLANCSLTGGVPTTYVTLTDLAALDLSGNSLGGALPALPFASLGKLAALNLSGNAFEGPLPPLWYGMAGAEVIDVSQNALSGPGFPSEWGVPATGNALKLQQLWLSPGNHCMTVSNATVVEASGGACMWVMNAAAARAANRQGRCAVVYEQQPGGCVP